MSQFFGHAFWRSLPSASQQFPPVGSALLAMASMHRRYKELGDSSSSQATEKSGPEIFAAVQYGKALRQLIHDMARRGDGDRSDCRLMCLVCGVLFIIIEVLQGDNRKALAHLDGVIQLLDETQGTTTGQRLMTDLEQELRPIISRFDVEASIFSTTRPPRLALPPLASLSQDDAQTTRSFHLDQAADEFNTLVAHVSHFKRTQANTIRYETGGDVSLEALHTQQQLAAHFQTWWQSNAVPLRAITPPVVDPEGCSRAALLLQIQYHAVWTMLKCCLNAEEMDYDRYLDEFSELVRLAALLVKSHRQWAASTATSKLRNFSPETGVVFPLYWTCLRCRHGRVRRAALGLLRQCFQEGVWVPEMHACVAERAIEVEEGLSRGSLSLEGTVGLPFPDCADVHEFRRIHCVGLDVDESRQAVRMTYHRRRNGPDGGWNMDQEWLYYGNGAST